MAKQVISDVHTFLNARMNTDDADIALKENEYRMIKNSLATAPGYVGKLKKMKGFKNVLSLALNSDFSLPSGTFTVIGSCEDIKNSAIVYLLCDTMKMTPSHLTKNHGIFRMFTANQKLEWISRADSIWNFQENVKLYLNIEEDLLYINGGYEGTPFIDFNPPQKINMVKACALTNVYDNTKTYYPGMVVGYQVYDPATAGTFWHSYRYIYSPPSSGNIPTSPFWEVANISRYSALTPQILDRIKYPLTSDISATYIQDTTVKNNNLRGHLIKIKALYTYDDKEKSVYSCDSDIPLPQGDELVNGNFVEDVTVNNAIQISFNTGSAEVIRIDIAVSIGGSGFDGEGNVTEVFENWSIVKTIEKYDANGNILIPSNIPHIYYFYNDTQGYAVSPDDVNRFQDSVPQISFNETFVEDNRLLDADYIQDYDNTQIDVSLTASRLTIPTNTNMGSTTNGTYQAGLTDTPITIAIPNGAIGQMYILTVRRLTELNDGTPPAYPNAQGDTMWVSVIWEAGDTQTTMCRKLVDQVNTMFIDLYDLNYPYPPPPPLPIQYMAYQYGHLWPSANAHPISVNWPQNNDILYVLFGTTFGYGTTEGTYNYYYIESMVLDVIVPTPKYTCFKSGSWHFLGIEYLDRALRRSQVNISDASKIYVPFVTENAISPGIEPYYTLKLNINSQPPLWADFWRVVYKPGVDFCMAFSIPLADIYNDSMNTYVALNNTISAMALRSPNFSIENYEWKQGDRIRFVKAQQADSSNQPLADQSYLYFPSLIDFEILGTTYAEYDSATQTNNNWYEHDKTGGSYNGNEIAPDATAIYSGDPSVSLLNSAANVTKYGPQAIRDALGNKVLDIGKQKLVLPKVNQDTVGWPSITETSPNGSYSTFYITVEVYRPSKNGAGAIVVYNEIDSLRPVLNPHTANCAHGGLSGQVYSRNQVVINGVVIQSAIDYLQRGDCYFKLRVLLQTSTENSNTPALNPTKYWCEAREFSDYYKSDYLNIGRPNITNPDIKRTRYISQYIWSGSYHQNTNLNDLSRVDASDMGVLQDKFGNINFVQQVGFMLKVLQTKKPTSVPVNRVAFEQANGGDPTVGSSQKVLGTPEPHPSDYGTTHFTGVVKHENRIYFPDLYAGLILMDSDNGIHPISMEYKVHNFVSSHFASFLNDGIQNISIYSAYDELYGLVYFSFVDSVNPSLNFTIAFKEGTEQTSGFLAFDFVPDFYGSTKDTVTSWKNGLWVHNSNAVPLMNFYGTQYYPVISFVVNKATGITQDFKAMTLNATEEWFAPNAGDLTIDANGTYREKQTKIPKGKFRKKEGKYYTDIPRNMLTHSNTPTMGDMLTGDVMRGQTMKVTMTNDTADDSEMTAITVNSNYSTGT
jgi:hypothetical protein